MVDDIAAGRFKAQTGVAFAFTSIDGIGEKTAQKVQAATGADVPKQVADYNASTLANEANISESRARKIIREGGGSPDVDSRGTSGGSVGAGNLPLRKGDFLPNVRKHDKAEAQHSDRSRGSRRMDNRRRAPVTTDYETWSSNPDHFDYPGVDTPTERPKALPKDYKSGGEIKTTDPDKDREIATGTGGGEFLRRIEGKREPASVIIDDSPDEGNFTAPGLAPGDFENDFENTRGQPVSSRRLPATVDLAEDREADMAFALSEEARKEKQRDRALDNMLSKSKQSQTLKTPTTPPNPLDEGVEGSVLVEHTQTGDLFSVTKGRSSGELYFENRTNRDTFTGDEETLIKFYDPLD